MNSHRITGIIRHYTRKARDQIYNAGLIIFKEAGIVEHLDDIAACVDELIKNAVKANYKHLLIFRHYSVNSNYNIKIKVSPRYMNI